MDKVVHWLMDINWGFYKRYMVALQSQCVHSLIGTRNL